MCDINVSVEKGNFCDKPTSACNIETYRIIGMLTIDFS